MDSLFVLAKEFWFLCYAMRYDAMISKAFKVWEESFVLILGFLWACLLLITVWFYALSTALITSLSCFQWNWFILQYLIKLHGANQHICLNCLFFYFNWNRVEEWNPRLWNDLSIYWCTSSKYSKLRAHKILLNLSWNSNQHERLRKFCIFPKSHTGLPGSITAHSLMKRLSVGQERGVKSVSSVCV